MDLHHSVVIFMGTATPNIPFNPLEMITQEVTSIITFSPRALITEYAHLRGDDDQA